MRQYKHPHTRDMCTASLRTVPVPAPVHGGQGQSTASICFTDFGNWFHSTGRCHLNQACRSLHFPVNRNRVCLLLLLLMTHIKPIGLFFPMGVFFCGDALHVGETPPNVCLLHVCTRSSSRRAYRHGRGRGIRTGVLIAIVGPLACTRAQPMARRLCAQCQCMQVVPAVVPAAA